MTERGGVGVTCNRSRGETCDRQGGGGKMKETLMKGASKIFCIIFETWPELDESG